MACRSRLGLSLAAESFGGVDRGMAGTSAGLPRQGSEEDVRTEPCSAPAVTPTAVASQPLRHGGYAESVADVSAVLCATPQIFKKIKEMQAAEEGDASVGDL